MEHKNKNTSYNPTPSKILNTIYLDQKQPLVEPTLGSHPNLLDPPHASITEKGKISLNEWFTKPVVITSGVWQTTDAVNTVLFTVNLLDIFQKAPTPAQLSLSGNAYFRSGIDVEVRISASPFHAGKLIFYYVPPQVDVDKRESIYAKNMFPSLTIDAGNNTHGVLHIPFVTIKDYFATFKPDGKSDFGNVNIAVLNPLRIGTGGSTSVSYVLSSQPTENEIAVPILRHDVEIQSDLGLPIPVDLQSRSFFSSLKGILEALEGGNSPDSFSGPSHKFNLPDLVPSNPPHGVTPNPPPAPVPDIPSSTTIAPVMDASAPSVANRSGLTSEHLSLTPERTKNHDPNESMTREMQLKVVAKTPSLIQICNYTTTNVVNDVIFTAPITPTLVAGDYYQSGTTPVNGMIYPSYIQHAVTPFAYWRGSLDFHFSFAATEQHKGKVLVAYIPNDTLLTGLPSYSAINSLSVFPNEVFDLSMNRDFTFKVPYNTETEYKEISYPYILPTDGSAPQVQLIQRYTTGTIVMVVYNRLTVPGTVTPTLNFNVYLSAGEDFEFHGLRDVANSVFPVSYIQIQSSDDVVYEASLEGMRREKANNVGIVSKLLGPSTFQSDSDETRLDKLLSRYYPQFAYQFTATANNSKSVLITPTPGQIEAAPRTANLSDPVFRNLISHYKQLYAFWEGSLNQFIIHNSTVNNPVILSLTHVPNLFNSSTTAYADPSGQTAGAVAGFTSQNGTTLNSSVDLSLSSMYSHLSNLRVNPTVEITVPHRSKFRRLYPQLVNDNPDTNATGVLYLRYSNPTADDIVVAATVFQSLGDDFRFKYLIPPLSRSINANPG